MTTIESPKKEFAYAATPKEREQQEKALNILLNSLPLEQRVTVLATPNNGLVQK